MIERQTAHMARLLDDLLDVSRITRGRLEVRRARVALRSVVDAAVETARPTIDAGKHKLEVTLADDPLTLDVDALRISQVLANLLTNAAKYTDPGGTIRLNAERVGGDVVIRVADNGIGLALSKALVALHGGTLEGRSEGRGKGSVFTVRLPPPPGSA